MSLRPTRTMLPLEEIRERLGASAEIYCATCDVPEDFDAYEVHPDLPDLRVYPHRVAVFTAARHYVPRDDKELAEWKALNGEQQLRPLRVEDAEKLINAVAVEIYKNQFELHNIRVTPTLEPDTAEQARQDDLERERQAAPDLERERQAAPGLEPLVEELKPIEVVLAPPAEHPIEFDPPTYGIL